MSEYFLWLGKRIDYYGAWGIGKERFLSVAKKLTITHFASLSWANYESA
jgi:hypothetical protein